MYKILNEFWHLMNSFSQYIKIEHNFHHTIFTVTNISSMQKYFFSREFSLFTGFLCVDIVGIFVIFQKAFHYGNFLFEANQMKLNFTCILNHNNEKSYLHIRESKCRNRNKFVSRSYIKSKLWTAENTN